MQTQEMQGGHHGEGLEGTGGGGGGEEVGEAVKGANHAMSLDKH